MKVKVLNKEQFDLVIQETKSYDDSESDYRKLILCMAQVRDYSLEEVSYFLENVIEILNDNNLLLDFKKFKQQGSELIVERRIL